MAPRRTVYIHITSIITNSSTSGGALAAAGSTHARGTLTLPTRDEEQAAAWLLALLKVGSEQHFMTPINSGSGPVRQVYAPGRSPDDIWSQGSSG